MTTPKKPDKKQEETVEEPAAKVVEPAAETPEPEAEVVTGQATNAAPKEDDKTAGAGAAQNTGDRITGNLGRIMGIELDVTVSFGSTKRRLKEVLKLGPGTLLELDRDAHDPVLLKVNDKVFAKGEVVDAGGYYGVQITEIVTPVERITSLGGS
jgi:flagellar motor switch protein FliN/FliY